LAKATTVVNGLPQSVPSAGERHPHLYGMLVALAGLLLVALPAAVSAFSAAFSFTGCTTDGIGRSSEHEHGIFACHEAQPLMGTLAALVALALLALPVIAGVLTARQFSRRPGSARALKILALVVLLGMAVPCIFYSAIMILGTF
jgi:drug/metabolite transporter (DMT)-like permease